MERLVQLRHLLDRARRRDVTVVATEAAGREPRGWHERVRRLAHVAQQLQLGQRACAQRRAHVLDRPRRPRLSVGVGPRARGAVGEQLQATLAPQRHHAVQRRDDADAQQELVVARLEVEAPAPRQHVPERRVRVVVRVHEQLGEVRVERDERSLHAVAERGGAALQSLHVVVTNRRHLRHRAGDAAAAATLHERAAAAHRRAQVHQRVRLRRLRRQRADEGLERQETEDALRSAHAAPVQQRSHQRRRRLVAVHHVAHAERGRVLRVLLRHARLVVVVRRAVRAVDAHLDVLYAGDQGRGYGAAAHIRGAPALEQRRHHGRRQQRFPLRVELAGQLARCRRGLDLGAHARRRQEQEARAIQDAELNREVVARQRHVQLAPAPRARAHEHGC
mmetsp:Transcript_4478/g.16359  ORF Transcript_4478/g.16359 Transcript_4478/m.16359 type:complete len:392 (-) Transcript_4478:118-1293(-)